jgi:hypothetical protein
MPPPMPISPASNPAPEPETIPSQISHVMLTAAAPALGLANAMAVGLGQERPATNENPEHGQHPKQHTRPDGTDDPDLRSLSKSLKIEVTGWAGPLAS